MKKNSYNIIPVDCAIKAYLLGFIACDGSLYENGSKLQLEIVDESVIQLFSEAMNANYVGYDKYDKRTNKTYHGYRLYKSITDIIDIYKGRTKSERHLPIDLIPDEYIPLLIRGVFDADGTLRGYVYTERRIDVTIEIASSKNIVYDIFEIIKKYTGIIGHITDNKSYYSYFIYDKYNFVYFLQWIYQYQWFLPMPRKYIKAVEIINTMIKMGKSKMIPNINDAMANKEISPFSYKPFYIPN